MVEKNNSFISHGVDVLWQRMDGHSFSFREISELSFPPQLQSFLIYNIVHTIELSLLSANIPYIDNHDEHKKKAIAVIKNEILQGIVLTRDELKKELEEALQIHFQFVSKPLSTMARIVFSGGTKEIAYTELIAKLSVFKENSYLGIIATKYLSSTTTVAISREEFVKLLMMIDARTMHKLTVEKKAKFSIPIFSFFEMIEVHRIPISIIQQYYKDKNCEDILKLFEDAQENDVISQEEFFQKTTKTTNQSSDEFESKLFIPEIKNEEAPKEDIILSEVEKKEMPPEQFLPTDDELKDMDNEEVTIKKKVILKPREKHLEIKIKPKESRVNENQKGKQLEPNKQKKDLNIYFSDKEKEKIIKKIFKKKSTEYSSAIQLINEFASWKEAAAYIDEAIFTKNKTDIFSNEALLFIDKAQTMFSHQDV